MQNLIAHSPTTTSKSLVSFQFKASGAPILLYSDPSVQSILGWTTEDLMTSHRLWLSLVHPEDRPEIQAQISDLSDGQSIQCDYRIQNQAGAYQWVRSQFFVVPTQNRIFGTWLDLSEIKRSETQRKRYTNLLENIVEAAHTLFYPAELELGMSKVLAKIGTVTEVDRVYFLGLGALTGSSQSSDPREQTRHGNATFFAWGRQGAYENAPIHWLKKSFNESQDNPIWQRLCQGRSLSGEVEQMPAEIAALLTKYHIHSILLLPILQNNRFFGVLGFENSQSPQRWTNQELYILEQLTITLGVALKQFHVESRLSHYAFHDPLTELPNRALLINRLEQCLRRKARQTSYSFAVLFLDLDRFKPVNDRLGHEVGDHLLIQVAQRISSIIRPGDTVARLGGDEFVILLDTVANIADAESAIHRLRDELTRCFLIDGNEIYIDASVGIALSSMEYKNAEAILQKADLAMYQAKNAGKGCYRIFEKSMHSQMILESNTESGMHLALQREEFEVHYQPIVSLDSGLIKGFEALVRWKHPKMGLLGPSQFIPIAEETGMIKALGMQVLQMACQQASQWQKNIPNCKDLTINVNFSAKQFVQTDLVQSITSILEQTYLPPSCLHLELTESVVIRKDAETLDLINQLRSLGIKIFLDDFGAGYSSLQYLNYFPINGLKIDRMFTQKIPINPQTQAIVRSIIIMAQALKMDIVVEGIENQKQIDYLNYFQGISGQGFLLSRPIPAKNAQSLLLQNETLT